MSALSQSGEGRKKCLDDFRQALGGGERGGWWEKGHSLIYFKPNLKLRHMHTMVPSFPLTRGLDRPCPHASKKARVVFWLSLSLCHSCLSQGIPLPTCAWYKWSEDSELVPTLALIPYEDLGPCSTKPAELGDKIRKKAEKREAEEDQAVTCGTDVSLVDSPLPGIRAGGNV